jgi:hypothetical protein
MGGKQPSKAHLDKPCKFSPGVVIYCLSESTLHLLFNHQIMIGFSSSNGTVMISPIAITISMGTRPRHNVICANTIIL